TQGAEKPSVCSTVPMRAESSSRCPETQAVQAGLSRSHSFPLPWLSWRPVANNHSHSSAGLTAMVTNFPILRLGFDPDKLFLVGPIVQIGINETIDDLMNS